VSPPPGGAPAPTALAIELFRLLEDVHDATDALVVLLVDADGASVAVSGDEAHLPAPLRAALGGKRLAEAGSVVALLQSVAADLADSPLNVSLYDVDGAHVLAIAFDAEADLVTVQTVGRQASAVIAELLAAPEP
jgi:hypothetical protein